jgi:cytochrome c-type biogenesis protein CcmI
VSFTFFLGVALFAGAVLFFVLQPLLSGRSAPMGWSDEEMTDAEARRRVSLLALRDVEYDRVTGKLDERDYQALKREISAEALAALEAEKAERQTAAAGVGSGGGAIVLDLATELRRVRQGLSSRTTCRTCGHVNPSGSRFCSTCGGALGPGGGAGEGKGG